MLNLSLVADNRWPLVTRTKNRNVTATHVDRQFFEACTLAQIAEDLKSNALCIPLGSKLGDYRERLVSWGTYRTESATYSERMNILVDPKQFVERLRGFGEGDAGNGRSLPSSPYHPI